MPLDEQHQRKKYKNYTLLVVLLLVAMLFFAVTVIKFHA